MKLQAIRALCVKAKKIIVLDTRDGQWIGDGCAYYPVDGARIGRENVYALLDITSKQAKYAQQRSDDPRITRFQLGPKMEEAAAAAGPVFERGGKLLQGVAGESGLVFFDTKYLGPVERTGAALSYTLRKLEGWPPSVAVHVDMRPGAVIWPMRGGEEIRHWLLAAYAPHAIQADRIGGVS